MRSTVIQKMPHLILLVLIITISGLKPDFVNKNKFKSQLVKKGLKNAEARLVRNHVRTGRSQRK